MLSIHFVDYRQFFIVTFLVYCILVIVLHCMEL